MNRLIPCEKERLYVLIEDVPIDELLIDKQMYFYNVEVQQLDY